MSASLKPVTIPFVNNSPNLMSSWWVHIQAVVVASKVPYQCLHLRKNSKGPFKLDPSILDKNQAQTRHPSNQEQSLQNICEKH